MLISVNAMSIQGCKVCVNKVCMEVDEVQLITGVTLNFENRKFVCSC